MTIDLSPLPNPFASEPDDVLLFDPRFWKLFIEDCKDSDHVLAMIKSLANRKNIPEERVRKRLQAYMRGRQAEIDAKTHPGSNAIH